MDQNVWFFSNTFLYHFVIEYYHPIDIAFCTSIMLVFHKIWLSRGTLFANVNHVVTISCELKSSFFYESAHLLNWIIQDTTTSINQHKKSRLSSLSSMWWFFILFIYPCTLPLNLSLQSPWNFSGWKIFCCISIRSMDATIPFGFQQVYYRNFIQT